MPEPVVLITCEHAGNHIPDSWRDLPILTAITCLAVVQLWDNLLS